ncbi:MAG: type II restriction endonuclease [Spirochaetaceae bacterium]|nr:type II restriction endonuclease [Spirochaetaceae bacterium]
MPLKDWDINIYRGVLTGYNEAFIISGEKRAELIKADPKSDEIIRPILRGRDIKRYGYEFADLYLICTFPAKRIDIEKYPAVKKHLLSFGMERLEQTGKEHIINGERIKSRKKTNNKWFETQDQIGYWEDFYRQVIAWQRITKENQFCLTEKGTVILDSMAFLSNIETCKHWLLAFLNSNIVYMWIKWNVSEYGDTGFRLSNQYVENIPIPNPTKEIEAQIESLIHNKDYSRIDRLVYEVYGLDAEEIALIEYK